jgi:hypothetical protein
LAALSGNPARRTETVQPPLLAVVPASSLSAATPVAGITHDISRSALSLLMPQPPSATHLDVTVHDPHLSVRLWVRIIDCIPTDNNMYMWHARVVTADDGWSGIVHRINH